MANICIVLVLGTPGMGKTYLCKYLDTHLSKSMKITHIMYDEIYKLNQKDLSYKQTRNKNLEFVKKILAKIEPNDTSSWIIFIDDIMYYKSMRYEYYKLARDYCSGFCEIIVNCELNTAIARNSARSTGKVNENVLCNIFNKLEKPSDRDWEQYWCIIDSEREYNESTVETCKNLILEAMKNPVRDKNTIPSECFNSDFDHSLVHKFDLMLRKAIHNKLTELRTNQNSQTVATISAILRTRKAFLLRTFPSSTEVHKHLLENITESHIRKLLFSDTTPEWSDDISTSSS